MALSQRMLDGYQWHGADFPNIIRMKLFSKRMLYINARKALVEVRSKLRIETKAASEKFSELVKVMKNCLQKSEVDVAAYPEKLKLIGWAPKESPQPATLPGRPENLQVVAKDNAILVLKWDRPAGSCRVRNYIIERRLLRSGSGFIDWAIVKIAYQTQVRLTQQPIGLKLEYRVKAANNAGTGQAGNTIAIVM